LTIRLKETNHHLSEAKTTNDINLN
jgi:hypothetical protein